MFAINLDDQASIVDCKVRNIGSDRCLLTNMNAEPSTELAKLAPQLALASRHLATQATRTRDHAWIDQCGHVEHPHP